MKGRTRFLIGVGILVLGALVALGPRYLLPVCEYRDGAQAQAGHSMGGMSHASMEGMSHDGSMTAMADTPAREHMACFYTASAALVTGSLTSLAGIGFMLSVRASMRRMTAVLLGVLGGLVILTPLYIYPTCESPEMFCNQGARQLLIVLGVTLLLAAGWFGLRPGGDRQYAVAS